MHRIYGAVHVSVSVLSLPSGITVWCRSGVFEWSSVGGGRTVVPAADVQEVVRLLLATLHT
ncbi:hypothetical protein [Marinitenerispora sediminis]|uniref:hypothetical protein n=1 Tax=Marinitenerispora sediminis TaxID=1931232 RepID=UPI0011C026B7|nr:hypothetical protein [Marinitenerispora sediminis]